MSKRRACKRQYVILAPNTSLRTATQTCRTCMLKSWTGAWMEHSQCETLLARDGEDCRLLSRVCLLICCKKWPGQIRCEKLIWWEMSAQRLRQHGPRASRI